MIMKKYFKCPHCGNIVNVDVKDNSKSVTFNCSICSKKIKWNSPASKNITLLFTLLATYSACVSSIFISLTDHSFIGALNLMIITTLMILVSIDEFHTSKIHPYILFLFIPFISFTSFLICFFNVSFVTLFILIAFVLISFYVMSTSVNKKRKVLFNICSFVLILIGFVTSNIFFEYLKRVDVINFNQEIETYSIPMFKIQLWVYLFIEIITTSSVLYRVKFLSTQLGIELDENIAKETIAKQKAERDSKIQEVKKYQEVYDKKENDYKEYLSQLETKYGAITKQININGETLSHKTLNSQLIIFEGSNKVLFKGRLREMSDFIDCSMVDNSKVIGGATTAEVKTQSGNMIKRAIVGDVLLGGAGAIIGAATSKKKITYNTSPAIETHDYKVVINLNDFSEPIVTLQYGSNYEKANMIFSLLKIIVTRGKNK